MFAPFDTTYAADLEVELELSFASDPALELVAADAAPAAALVRTAITPVEVARAAIYARRAAATVSPAPDALDDDWFGSFDETKPVDGADFDDQPTTTWRRISDWLLRRAA
jgi:hypothetical protein